MSSSSEYGFNTDISISIVSREVSGILILVKKFWAKPFSFELTLLNAKVEYAGVKLLNNIGNPCIPAPESSLAIASIWIWSEFSEVSSSLSSPSSLLSSSPASLLLSSAGISLIKYNDGSKESSNEPLL